MCNKSSRATPRAMDDWFAPWERSIEISFLLLYFHLLPLFDQTYQWGMFGCSTELKSPMSDKCPGRKTSNGFISCLCRRRGRFVDAFYNLKCIFDKIALAACLVIPLHCLLANEKGPSKSLTANIGLFRHPPWTDITGHRTGNTRSNAKYNYWRSVSLA